MVLSLDTAKAPERFDDSFDYNSYYSDASPRGPTPEDPAAREVKKVLSLDTTYTDESKDERPLVCQMKLGDYCPSEWPKSIKSLFCQRNSPTPNPSPAVAEVEDEISENVDDNLIIEIDDIESGYKLLQAFIISLSLIVFL